MLMRWILAAALALPLSAQAQPWATRAVCDVKEPRFHESVFDDMDLDTLIAEAQAIPNGVGKYWQITSPDGAVSHLWGTYHSSDPHMLRLPERLQTDIAAARVVALEIDPVYPSRKAYIADIRSDTRFRAYRDNFMFSDLGFDPKLTLWIRARLDYTGWRPDNVNTLRLGALLELMLMDPCEDFAAWIIPTQDSYIQTLGLMAGAQIVGLEPVTRLSDRLNDPDAQELAKAVLQVYATYHAPREDSRTRATAFKLYLEGRIGMAMAWDKGYVLSQLGENGPPAYALMDNYMVVERNRDFVTAAVPHLEAGGAVLAVGNFHLPGAQGMIEMLRGEGYDVTRVPLPGEVQ